VPRKRGAVAAPGHKTKFTKRELRDAMVEHAIKGAESEFKELTGGDRPVFLMVDSRGKILKGVFGGRSYTLRNEMRDGSVRAVDIRTGKVYVEVDDLPKS
jgi:hypothetical protein